MSEKYYKKKYLKYKKKYLLLNNSLNIQHGSSTQECLTINFDSGICSKFNYIRSFFKYCGNTTYISNFNYWFLCIMSYCYVKSKLLRKQAAEYIFLIDLDTYKNLKLCINLIRVDFFFIQKFVYNTYLDQICRILDDIFIDFNDFKNTTHNISSNNNYNIIDTIRSILSYINFDSSTTTPHTTQLYTDTDQVRLNVPFSLYDISLSIYNRTQLNWIFNTLMNSLEHASNSLQNINLGDLFTTICDSACNSENLSNVGYFMYHGGVIMFNALNTIPSIVPL